MLEVTERPASRIQTHVPPHELPAVYPHGRGCAEEGCITVLCQFNPGPWCYCHASLHEEALAQALIESEWDYDLASAA